MKWYDVVQFAFVVVGFIAGAYVKGRDNNSVGSFVDGMTGITILAIFTAVGWLVSVLICATLIRLWPSLI